MNLARIHALARAVLVFLPLAVAACGPTMPATQTPLPIQEPAAPTMPPNQDSWILVDLPEDATQLQHGAEIYRLVCSACHAHSGEGLTDAWRATWNPDDQDCWQSKCHAANHPPDGFELPMSPAVVGRAALAPFATAADLHDYIQATMPWQDPNGLTEEEGWAVTAYVIKLNRMNPGPELNAENASQFSLHPEAAVSTATAAAQAETPPARTNWLWVPGGLVLASLAMLMALRTARQSRGRASPRR